jgi:hypothetical protein
MSITINGSGTVTGISAGGLPDASIVTADIADANVTAAKLSGAQTGSAPIYGCRAWVNFDGTRNEADTGASTDGANVKIRASGNVSSVLKNGTGDYTVTFTTAMVDANYVITGGAGNYSGAPSDDTCIVGTNATTATPLVAGSARLRTWSIKSAQATVDPAFATVAIFR